MEGRAQVAGRSRWLQLAALCGVPFTMVLGNAMLMPVLTDLARQLNLGKPAAGLAVTAFSLSAGLKIPLAGYAADRWGRKLVILVGLALFALGALVAGFSAAWFGEGAYWPVIIGRVIQGSGGAGMAYMALAFAGDLFNGSTRVTALGILEASAGVGKLAAPVVGALIGQALIWWNIFFVHALTAGSVLVAVWLLTVEPNQGEPHKSGAYFASLWSLLRQKGTALAACLGTGAVNQFVLFGVLFFVSQHLELAHGVEGVAKGWVLMWPLLAMSVLSFGSGLFLQHRYGLLKPAVLAGVLTVLAGTLLMALVTADWGLFTGVMLVGTGTGLQLPALNDLIVSSANQGQRAGITSLYGAVRFLGTGFGPPLFGLLMGIDETLPFWVASGLLLVTALLVLLWINPARLQPRGGGDQPSGKATPEWRIPANLPQGTRGNR